MNNGEQLQKLVGQNIKYFRKKLGLTQEKLAEQSDFGYKYIQEIGAGNVNITLRSMARIGAVLKTHPRYFFQPRRKAP